jgi:hypothetical protein
MSEQFNFVVALEIAKRRFASSRYWKMLVGTPWENDAPVFAADMMHETYRFYSDDLAEKCWTVAQVALRQIVSEQGCDPVSGDIDWQRCVDRIHTRALKALDEVRQLEQSHADAFLAARDSGDLR